MGACIPGFHTARQDPVAGVMHLGNGYRAYHPHLMRFHCPDDVSPFGAGGINAYAYCTGDPVNRSDPSGHQSLGSWLGIAAGVALGLLMTPVSGGASLAVALSVLSVTTAVASAGLAVAQQFVDTSAPGTASALGWAALGTGLLSGLSSAALSRLIPGARSLVSLLKGTARRPLGGLMVSAERGVPPHPEGQFRRAGFIGVFPHPQPPGHHMAFHFLDNLPGGARLNIYGMPALTSAGRFAVGSGVWKDGHYQQELLGYWKIASIIHREMSADPAIHTVRLLVPFAGNVIKEGSGTFRSRVAGTLWERFHRLVPLTGPSVSFDLTGGATVELNTLQNSLHVAGDQLVTGDGIPFIPGEAQRHLNRLSERFGNVPGAFSVEGVF